MKEIFVVTKGEYSDYRIEGVCSTRERAEKMARCRSDEYEEAFVETYLLDADPIEDEDDIFEVRYRPSDNKIDAIYVSTDLTFTPFKERGMFIFQLSNTSRAIREYLDTGDTDLALKVAQDKYSEHMYNKINGGM